MTHTEILEGLLDNYRQMEWSEDQAYQDMLYDCESEHDRNTVNLIHILLKTNDVYDAYEKRMMAQHDTFVKNVAENWNLTKKSTV